MSGRGGSLCGGTRPQQSPLAQIVQHQRVERHGRGCEQVGPSAAGDVLLHGQAVGVEVALVLLEQRLGDRHLGQIRILHVAQFQVALQWRVDLLGGEDMDGEQVVLAAGHVAQAVLVAALVEEVGEDDANAFLAVGEGEAAAGVGEVAGAVGRLELVEEVEHRRDLGPPAQAAGFVDDAIGEGAEADPVVVDQPDVPQGGRNLLHVQRLVGIAVVAALGYVHEHVERQVLFFEEELEEEAFEAGVDVPVDEAEVVADDVVAVVGELHALAPSFAAALALHLAGEDLAADQIELVQPGHELGGKEDLAFGRRARHGRFLAGIVHEVGNFAKRAGATGVSQAEAGEPHSAAERRQSLAHSVSCG